ASMAALLRELERDPRRLTRRAAVGALALLSLGAVALLVLQHLRQRALLCTGAEAQLAGVWDPARRAQVRGAFVSVALPFAPGALASVEKRLDAFASAWTAMHTEACEATRKRGEQSEELLDLRMQCLGERLSDARALVDELARADARAARNAPVAAQ